MTLIEERILIQWATDSHSLVEIEAFCTSLEKHPQGKPIHLTLSLEGEKPPKFSELKKLLHLLEPLIQKEGTLHIYCENHKVQTLLEFCGFSFVAQLIKERTSISNFAGKSEPVSES